MTDVSRDMKQLMYLSRWYVVYLCHIYSSLCLFCKGVSFESVINNHQDMTQLINCS